MWTPSNERLHDHEKFEAKVVLRGQSRPEPIIPSFVPLFYSLIPIIVTNTFCEIGPNIPKLSPKNVAKPQCKHTKSYKTTL